MATYTIRIEGAAPNTPVIVSRDPDKLTRQVVGYRNADWQALTSAETVDDLPGMADQIAIQVAANQTVADVDGEIVGGEPGWRVQVWEGTDTSGPPDAEYYP